MWLYDFWYFTKAKENRITIPVSTTSIFWGFLTSKLGSKFQFYAIGTSLVIANTCSVLSESISSYLQLLQFLLSGHLLLFYSVLLHSQSFCFQKSHSGISSAQSFSAPPTPRRKCFRWQGPHEAPRRLGSSPVLRAQSTYSCGQLHL